MSDVRKPLVLNNGKQQQIRDDDVLNVPGGVSIGNNPPTLDQSAALVIDSTDKGILIPRMTTSQRIAINLPANGLLVFDTDLNKLTQYQDDDWTIMPPDVITGGTY